MKITVDNNSLLWYEETGQHKQVARQELTETEESAISALFSFTQNYKSPEEQALEEIIKDAADKAEPEKLILLVKPFKEGENLEAGDLRSFEGLVYRVTQPHTTQDNWNPTRAITHWSVVGTPQEIEEDVTPAWVPGTYMLGDIRTHNGKTWESQVNNNVWEPGAPGVYENIWKEVI